MLIMCLMGAYGRRTNKADWEAGKDFRIGLRGPYCSKRDLEKMYELGVRRLEFVDPVSATGWSMNLVRNAEGKVEAKEVAFNEEIPS